MKNTKDKTICSWCGKNITESDTYEMIEDCDGEKHYFHTNKECYAEYRRFMTKRV